MKLMGDILLQSMKYFLHMPKYIARCKSLYSDIFQCTNCKFWYWCWFKFRIFYFSQTSDQTCATLVVDGEVADDVSTDTPEPDNLIVLNPECNAFKTPQSKCTFGLENIILNNVLNCISIHFNQLFYLSIFQHIGKSIILKFVISIYSICHIKHSLVINVLICLTYGKSVIIIYHRFVRSSTIEHSADL